MYVPRHVKRKGNCPGDMSVSRLTGGVDVLRSSSQKLVLPFSFFFSL